MTDVWTTFVNGVQGKFVKPVDIALPAQAYDMGRAVGARKPAPKATVTVVTDTAPAAPRTGTKADRVREMIAAAKCVGDTAESVVAAVVAELGMAKGLAKSYVKNNWSKV